MSKSTDQVLLFPGESGWDIWTGQAATGFTLHAATDITRAGDLTSIPSGDLTLFFPVKAITAIPMRVASEDDSLLPDIAAMHAESLGLRPDPMAGQLTDIFVIGKQDENTALLSVQLRSPVEGDLPTRSPKEFDLSARALPVSGECLAVWKEFDRWVFAAYHQGKLVYSQATAISSQHPEDALVREIRLALIQLSLQGIDLNPTSVILWTSAEDASAGALAGAFNAKVGITPRSAPILPEPRSKLLPADVRAARREAQRRQNIVLGVAAVVLVYLGLIGWFGYGLWKDHSATKKLIQQAEAAAPEGAAYALHIAQWDELTHGIDIRNSPVDILSRVARCIPPGSQLRLRTAEISATEIKLIGEAPQPQAVNQFSLALTKSNDLIDFTWQTPEPQQTNRGWEFVYTGTSAEAQP